MKYLCAIFLLTRGVQGADVALWETGDDIVPTPVRFAAREQADRMFAAIGVRLQWEAHRPVNLDGGLSIQVRFMRDTSANRDALAFASPFDPVPTVTVLYDRIQSVAAWAPGARATVLAHVLAHEIGHVLMKTNSHSPGGIMKTCWSGADWWQIAHGPLPFLPTDADMIRRGIITRAGAERVNRIEPGSGQALVVDFFD